jgi:hypothetical protein
MTDQAKIAEHLADIERGRARLKRMLRGQDARMLARRPPKGDWSIVENLRHLLWAEQVHLSKVLPGPVAWSPVGLTKFTAARFADVGTQPTDDVAVVFREWDRVHRAIVKALPSAKGDVERTLWGDARHLRTHTDGIERMLRSFDRQGPTDTAPLRARPRRATTSRTPGR